MGADRVVLGAFLVSTLFAGGNGVGIRFSNRELDPVWGAGLRFGLAAILFVGLMVGLRLALPRGRALAGAVAWGLLQFGGTYALAYYALVELHAGFGQILLGMVPLATVVLAAAQRQERLHTASVLGTILALVGVVAMSRAPLEDSLQLLSLLAAIGSAVCFAQAAILVRAFPKVHLVTMNAVGMTVGSAALVLGALTAGETIALPSDPETWVALVYLVLGGTVVVFLLTLFVLGHWSASRYAYTFVLIPIVTIVLSAWLDDEPVGLGLVLGGLLVLAGIYVGALRRTAAAT